MEKGEFIGTGRTAEVYAWGENRIIKLFLDWMPAAPIEREFAITHLVREAGLPVPEAEALVKVDGRLGIIFERLHGISMLEVLEKQPGKLIPISRLLAEYHARMHACILPLSIDSQRRQILDGIAWAKDLSESEKESIRGILAGLPDGDVICHGDFHPDNVLMTDHGPFIIDWMNGRRGHPLGDVARTALVLQTGRELPRGKEAHLESHP